MYLKKSVGKKMRIFSNSLIKKLMLLCPFLQLHFNEIVFVFSSRIGAYYGEDFTRGFDTQNYPKLPASLGTQPENTHEIRRQTQPNPYPWIFLGNTLGYPRVPAFHGYHPKFLSKRHHSTMSHRV